MRLIDADELKKALAEMWYESAISITGVSVAELIDEAPTIEPSKSTDQNVTDVPSGDLISRAEAINAFWEDSDIRTAEVRATLKALPSADAVHKPDYSYEADMVRRLKESRSADAVPQMEHDREWIIGCIKHDGFIKTDRFDKANQIILDALSAEAETKCVAQIKVDTEEIVRRIKEEYDITDGWIPCSERLPDNKTYVLTTIQVSGRQPHARSGFYHDGFFHNDNGDTWRATDREVRAWMPLPKPYREDGEV